MAEWIGDKSFFRNYLFGQSPKGFEGTAGFKGGQLRRLDAANQIYRAIQGTEQLGPAGESQITDWMKQATAQVQQDRVSGGLTNSTILRSNKIGIEAAGEKAKLALRESIQDRINSLRLNLADIFTKGSFGRAPPQSSGGLEGILGMALGGFSGGFGSGLGGSFFPKKP